MLQLFEFHALYILVYECVFSVPRGEQRYMHYLFLITSPLILTRVIEMCYYLYIWVNKEVENIVCKMSSTLSQSQCVTGAGNSRASIYLLWIVRYFRANIQTLQANNTDVYLPRKLFAVLLKVVIVKGGCKETGFGKHRFGSTASRFARAARVVLVSNVASNRRMFGKRYGV